MKWGRTLLTPMPCCSRSYKLQEDEIPDSVTAIARAGAGVNNIPLGDAVSAVSPFLTPQALMQTR
ncbi:MAG: hypothetical protein CM15mP74_18700 [Halieaceae bacterium]|nr:MAG: hypothetical protein CM15mP74_18700 [Halieaceae bacterium]